MKNITAGNKLFKSGKFMMTAAATIAVVASATATTLTSVNADDSVAPAKVTTSQKAEPQENHVYQGHTYDAPIRVETHDVWTANSESVIADNMSKQGIKSVDQLGDYKVVWGDTLSTIAAHFNVSVEELAQRFNIVDVNYIGAGVTMKEQRNLNALESQVIHDAQWNGQYNANVAASQASDAADAQADATPAANAPVANADAPAQAAKSSDTHVGGASDVINNIADGAKTNQTPAVTPADKPATETPKTDASAPATNMDKGNDTNIGNASDVIKGVDDGANTPATQPATNAPAVTPADKPATETPKTDAPAPATNTDKGNDTNIGNASDVIKDVDDGANTPATQPTQPATNAPTSAASSSAASSSAASSSAASSSAASSSAASSSAASSSAASSSAASSSAASSSAASSSAASSSAASSSAASSSAASSSATPVETQSPASDASMSHEVPANPVDGSTFVEVEPDSGRSFGTLTYHTSFSGISVNDLTHGQYQGLWFDHSGNAVDPYKAYSIFYTAEDMNNLVTRYNDAQTPVEGTELERPDQLVGGASNAPATNTDKGNDTNIGNASSVINSIG